MESFLQDESGATAIEYSLIAAMMAIGLIAAFPPLTTAINGLFTAIGIILLS